MSHEIVERLAAANPIEVPRGDPAGHEQLQTILSSDQDPPNRRYSAHFAAVTCPPVRRRVLRIALTATALAVVVAAVIAVTGSGNPGPSVLARAYAATASPGAILHYTESTDEPQTGPRRGALVTGFSSTAQVWETGDRSHQLETQTTRLTGNRRITRVTETATTPRGLAVYTRGPDTPRGLIVRLPGFHPRCVGGLQDSLTPALTGCSNPIENLRQLYASRALRSSGEATLDGRTVDVLSGSPDPPPHRPAQVQQTWRVIVLVDPRTFDPLEVREIETRRVRRPGDRPTSLTVITRFGRFERIPLTAANHRLLVLDPHPGARVITRRRASP